LNRDGKGGTGLVEGPEELAEASKEVNMPVMVKKRKSFVGLKENIEK
jgi:hypothetical protein